MPRLRHRADDPLGGLAVLEQDHGRDREDLVLGGGLLVVVDVEADDLQVVALGVDLLEDRVDDAAGTAPGRPEVDEHGAVGVEHVGLEVRVGYVGELARHFGLLVVVRDGLCSVPLTIQNEVKHRLAS